VQQFDSVFQRWKFMRSLMIHYAAEQRKSNIDAVPLRQAFTKFSKLNTLTK